MGAPGSGAEAGTGGAGLRRDGPAGSGKQAALPFVLRGRMLLGEARPLLSAARVVCGEDVLRRSLQAIVAADDTAEAEARAEERRMQADDEDAAALATGPFAAGQFRPRLPSAAPGGPRLPGSMGARGGFGVDRRLIAQRMARKAGLPPQWTALTRKCWQLTRGRREGAPFGRPQPSCANARRRRLTTAPASAVRATTRDRAAAVAAAAAAAARAPARGALPLMPRP